VRLAPRPTARRESLVRRSRRANTGGRALHPGRVGSRSHRSKRPARKCEALASRGGDVWNLRHVVHFAASNGVENGVHGSLGDALSTRCSSLRSRSQSGETPPGPRRS
jgi:hypothetical protein